MDVLRPRWMMGVITVGARCESLEVAGRRKALRIHREGADDLPPDDEGDAAGPAALLRAAAELIDRTHARRSGSPLAVDPDCDWTVIRL